jgi:hypothetical protein
MSKSKVGIYEVVWPRGKVAVKVVPHAKRLDTLEGKTICELWNGAYRGDETFPIIREELAKRYRGIKFISWEEFGRMGGPNEDKILAALPSKLKSLGCDAAIGGNGC